MFILQTFNVVLKNILNCLQKVWLDNQRDFSYTRFFAQIFLAYSSQFKKTLYTIKKT